MFTPLPPFAAWRFVHAVDGFEVLYASPGRLRGHTTAVENDRAYAVSYDLHLDQQWHTREAQIVSDTVTGTRRIKLQSDGAGTWTLDGFPAPHLDGLVDIDLESSACTNLLPVHRLRHPVGQVVETPAAYVQAFDLTVRRLEQTYARIGEHRFAYTSENGFRATLVYDSAGLILDYPGIATRFA